MFAFNCSKDVPKVQTRRDVSSTPRRAPPAQDVGRLSLIQKIDVDKNEKAKDYYRNRLDEVTQRKSSYDLALIFANFFFEI